MFICFAFTNIVFTIYIILLSIALCFYLFYSRPFTSDLCYIFLTDTPTPWDARTTTSPSLSEVAPPLESLSNPSASFHVNPPTDPPHTLSLETAVPDCFQGPRGPESRALEQSNVGMRSALAGGVGGGDGTKHREGSRTNRCSSRGKGQHPEELPGELNEPKPHKSSRAKSKERRRERSNTPSRKRDSPKTCLTDNNVNGGNGCLDGSSNQQGSPLPLKALPKEPEKGQAETRPSHNSKNNSSSASGRKATVSPGPWKIPGSDKLPSTLRSATSTISR